MDHDYGYGDYDYSIHFGHKPEGEGEEEEEEEEPEVPVDPPAPEPTEPPAGGAATQADLEALSSRIDDLACSAPIYDYFHVNAADAVLPLAMEMNPFNICVAAG